MSIGCAARRSQKHPVAGYDVTADAFNSGQHRGAIDCAQARGAGFEFRDRADALTRFGGQSLLAPARRGARLATACR